VEAPRALEPRHAELAHSIVPATTPLIPRILSTQPTLNNVTTQVPDYQAISAEDLPWLSQH